MNNQIVILPNRCTFPELVEQNYPYLFNDMDEQIEMLRVLIKDGTKQYKHKERGKLKLTNHAINIHKYFLELGKGNKTDIFNSIKKDASKKKIIEYFEHNDKIQIEVFKNFVFKLGYASQSFPNGKLKRILNEFDYDYNISLDKYVKT